MWKGGGEAPCRSKCYRRVVRLYRCIIPFLAAGIHPWVIRAQPRVWRHFDVLHPIGEIHHRNRVIVRFYYARERFRIVRSPSREFFRPLQPIIFVPLIRMKISPTIEYSDTEYSIWSWMERRREIEESSVIREIVKIISPFSSGASSLDFRFLLLYRPRSMRLAVETRFSSILSRVNCETIAGKYCIIYRGI